MIFIRWVYGDWNMWDTVIYEGDFPCLSHDMYAVVRGNHAYVVIGRTIFSVDISAMKWDVIGVLPAQYCKQSIVENNFFLDGEELLFFSGRGHGIGIFDIRTGKMHEIAWEGIEENDRDNNLYMVEKWNDAYILLSRKGNQLVLYKHKKVTVYTEWKEMLSQYITNKNYDFELVRYRDVMVYDKYFYMNIHTKQCDFIARFDLVNFTLVDVIEMNEPGQHFGLLLHEDSIYFQNVTERESCLIRWDMRRRCTADRWKICDGNCRRAYLFRNREKIFMMLGSGEIFCCRPTDGMLEKVEIPNGTVLYSGHDLEPEERLVVLHKSGMLLWTPSSGVYSPISVPWLKLLIEQTRLGA